jgi:hypothetical protein
MFTFSPKERWFCLGLLLVWSLTHASVWGGDPNDKGKETQAEKIRKSLDQTVNLDYSSQSFQDVIGHLKDKTGVPFVLDMFTLQQMGLGFEENPTPLQIKGEKIKLRQAVQRMLNSYNLTFVILEDSVLITTEEMGLARQMRQRVSVQVEETPLHKALKDLARTTALNLVIDPRLSKDSQTPVTLQVEDATLETAVRLLAELGGMKSVRMGNILFVTNEDRATKIRKEESAPIINNPAEVFLPGRAVFGGGGFGGAGVPPIVVPNIAPGPALKGIAQPIPPAAPVPEAPFVPPPGLDLPPPR